MTTEQQKSLDALVTAMQVLANAHIQILAGPPPPAPAPTPEPDPASTVGNAKVMA
jgi:hypothetical protein